MAFARPTADYVEKRGRVLVLRLARGLAACQDFCVNELQLKTELHSSESSDKIYLVAVLYIDGEPVADFNHYAVFLQELEKSTSSGGNYYILTCLCGMPECAGIYQAVQVVHEGDAIKWLWSQPKPKRNFTFNTVAYKQAVEIGIAEIRRDVKDLWVEGVEAKDQQLKIVLDFNASWLEPKVKSKGKRAPATPSINKQ